MIRYGVQWVQWEYEPDLPVVRQPEIIERVWARLDDPRMRFVDGEWYFQGRLAAVDGTGRANEGVTGVGHWRS